ncbi:MAG: hypothetical protein INR71_06830 [Terriglobus roseus]|nr:hypothetical protein [Terriglobus roseus]
MTSDKAISFKRLLDLHAIDSREAPMFPTQSSGISTGVQYPLAMQPHHHVVEAPAATLAQSVPSARRDRHRPWYELAVA